MIYMQVVLYKFKLQNKRVQLILTLGTKPLHSTTVPTGKIIYMLTTFTPLDTTWQHTFKFCPESWANENVKDKVNGTVYVH